MLIQGQIGSMHVLFKAMLDPAILDETIVGSIHVWITAIMGRDANGVAVKARGYRRWLLVKHASP